MMNIRFKADMQSEAMKTLGKLANLPLAGIHRILGRRAKAHVTTSYHLRMHFSDSSWQKLKQFLFHGVAFPGTFTGASYNSIRSVGDQKRAVVFLKGRWPAPGLNIHTRVPLQAVTGEESYQELSTWTEEPNTIGGTDWEEAGVAGATVVLSASSGLTVKWDPWLKLDKLEDIRIPPADLSTKQYGEFGRRRSFMYLTKAQLDDVYKVAGAVVGRLMGEKVSIRPVVDREGRTLRQQMEMYQLMALEQDEIIREFDRLREYRVERWWTD